MPRTTASISRGTLALAALLVGGSALSVPPRGGEGGEDVGGSAPGVPGRVLQANVCGRGFGNFEHHDETPAHRDFCLVFCVPLGDCSKEIFAGGTIKKQLNITGLGNCKHMGFTEPVALTPTNEKVTKHLKHLQGGCSRIRILRYRKPQQAAVETFAEAGTASLPAAMEPAPEPVTGAPAAETPAEAPEPVTGVPAVETPAEAPAPVVRAPPRKPPAVRPGDPLHFCRGEASPFQAITHERGADVCTVYCVPDGRCRGLAETGRLTRLNISAQGTCQGMGFSESMTPSKERSYWIKTLSGPCKGMTMSQFQRQGQGVAQSVQPGGRVCGHGTTAYESHTPKDPNACGVYCVPEGKCEGLVQSGSLKLGITQRGNCRAGGFTKPAARLQPAGAAAYAYNAARSFKGSCAGMTYVKFEKPLDA